MSNKGYLQIPLEDRIIRSTMRPGMESGTLMTIEFVAGFEMFNTRNYHNYETWGQGYRVSGRGITIEREDLDDAVRAWSDAVRDAQELPHLDENGIAPRESREDRLKRLAEEKASAS